MKRRQRRNSTITNTLMLMQEHPVCGGMKSMIKNAEVMEDGEVVAIQSCCHQHSDLIIPPITESSSTSSSSSRSRSNSVRRPCLYYLLFLSALLISLWMPQVEPYSSSPSSSSFNHSKNPFFNGGCLYQRKANWTGQVRVCGSEDPPEAEAMGYCRSPSSATHFDYMEIRIHGQNWEAAFFETWVLQILLSEVLHVPTSVETSQPNAKLNFYNIDARMDYGDVDDWACLEKGVQVGDCRNVLVNAAQPQGQDDYQSCCHFIPEVWPSGDLGNNQALERMGRIEPALPMGTIGEEHWFIPKFTAERDPTLLSYIGMAGPENRRKLAERFLRPTTWKEYCTEVSPTNCTTTTTTNGGTSSSNDTVAVRPPDPKYDGANSDRFFVEGLYQGHFRKTAKNDCDLNPSSCTGHIFDYPCEWYSYVVPQAYHLGISVEGDGVGPRGSGGYAYGDLVDALKAANATKSDILIFWWTPEALYQEFIGTDMELTQITLPPVTQECLENRIPDGARCSSTTLEELVGSPLGACGEAPQSLKKVIGARLYDSTYNEGIPEALHSPAYETLKAFQMSGAEMGQLFEFWLVGQSDPREAVCDWVVENFDRLQDYIPRTYPRVVVEDDDDDDDDSLEPLSFTSTFLASVAISVVALTAILTYARRTRPAMLYAQLEFLTFLLLGLMLVSTGSLLMSFPATNGLCVAAIWLTNCGYTLELVPLIVKMGAFYRLMKAAKRLRHAVMSRQALFGAVVLLSGFTIIFLIVWTVVDPPRQQTEYQLSDELTSDGKGIVEMTYFCESEHPGWGISSVGWHLLLLVVATIQAFQTRTIRQEVNESQTLAIMIYSHVMFVCLRLATLFLEQSLSQSDMMQMRSIIFSLDSVVTIALYFLPKFFSDDSKYDESEKMIGSETVKQLRMLAAVATAQHERQINRSMMERQEGGGGGGVTVVDEHERRLSLPREEFQAHLRDVKGVSMASTSPPSSSEDDNVPAPSRCRHCGKFD